MSETVKSTVVKTVSMPVEMFRLADVRVAADPELDWSKYIRRLIRQDLEQSKASTPVPATAEVAA